MAVNLKMASNESPSNRKDNTKMNCKECGKASKYCPTCGSPCVLCSRYIDELDVDEEPLCAHGSCNNNSFKEDTICEEKTVYVEYCPNCKKIVNSWVDNDSEPNKTDELKEYLRRNLLHCASVGANANTKAALKRINNWKKKPTWLLEILEGIINRTSSISVEMAKHRDEIKNIS